MNKDFKAGNDPEFSGRRNKPEPEEDKKQSRDEKEYSKLFAPKNPENQKLRPKRPRTTRVRPGEPRPYDAANNRRPERDQFPPRSEFDRTPFSYKDRDDSTRSRDDRPRGPRKPYTQNRTVGPKAFGSKSYRPGYSSEDKDYGNTYNSFRSDRPRRDSGSKDRDVKRFDRGGNRNEAGGFRKNFRDKPGGFRKPNTGPGFKKFDKPKKAPGPPPEPVKREFNDAGEMRLNRYLAHAGVSSRRQADDYIKAGLVTVNGIVVTEMGVKIKRGDDVRYNGERLVTEKKVYILLNKPKDYVTTADDEQGRKTVLDIIEGACEERVYPVGRLDRNTTGVMLLTNDGDLVAKLTHPKYEKKKVYHVVLDKNVKKTDLKKIADGIELEDGMIQADEITLISPDKKNEVGLEIHSGRNRIVRRIFEHLGYDVVRLDRVYFAGLTKKNLARGKWRFLTDKEISMLLMNSYE
jgi:23S rRNA pseudouridine2605 synthase